MYNGGIQYRINNQITAPEVRVVGADNENLGVLPLADALALAREKKLDLIEVAPNAKPPVARIIAYDKFRYQKEKELKKQRLAQKPKDLKQVRLTVRMGQGDMAVRLKKTEEFLTEGHRVELMLAFRGREKGNKEWGLQKLESFLTLITVPFTVVMPPRWSGRGFVSQIAKK